MTSHKRAELSDLEYKAENVADKIPIMKYIRCPYCDELSVYSDTSTDPIGKMVVHLVTSHVTELDPPPDDEEF